MESIGAQNITDGEEAKHLPSLIEELNLELISYPVHLDHYYFNDGEFVSIRKLLNHRQLDPEQVKHN